MGREVWGKAVEKTGGRKGMVILQSEDENSRKMWEDAMSSRKGKDASHEIRIVMINTSWEKNSALGRRLDPSTDLIVDVFTKVRTLRKGRVEPTGETVDRYYFSPTQVVKESRSIPPEDPKNLDEIFSFYINSPILRELALRRYKSLLQEQETLELYHPSKEDLEGLLSIVSSAKELPHLTSKVVPWPK